MRRRATVDLSRNFVTTTGQSPYPKGCVMPVSALRTILICTAAACLGLSSAGCIGTGSAASPPPVASLPQGELAAVEKARADAAVEEAVGAGSPRRWQGERPGYYGYVEPGPSVTVGDGQCREFTHTIFIDGRAKKDFGRACRGGTGGWKVMPPVGA
ncbi:MAG: hypothetical protein ACRCXM_13765 [Beijerinckiaceae bacterium]